MATRTTRRHRRQPSQGILHPQGRQCAGRLSPDSLKLDVVTLHDIWFFNQDLEAKPPADWLAFREKPESPMACCL